MKRLETTGFVESLIKQSKNNISLEQVTTPDKDYAKRNLVSKVVDFFGSTRLSVYLMYSFIIPIVISACLIFVYDQKMQNDLLTASQNHFGSQVDMLRLLSRNSAVIKVNDEFYLVRFNRQELVDTYRLADNEVFKFVKLGRQ